MKRKILFSYLFSLVCLIASAQTYPDHFGNGNNIGVSTNSSSTDTLKAAENVLNGTGYFPNEADASRFLYQAAFGGSYDDIDNLVNTGVENWIDEQLVLPPTSFKTHYDSVYQYISTTVDSVGLPHLDKYLSFTFYDMLMNNPDQLRQKMAFALSQILVISYADDGLANKSNANASYYDILYRNSFGNFKDILTEVTFHPTMGLYLSYYQNQKTDYAAGVYPDENFAREVMQLFSIGLVEMNNDGTSKLDSLGNEIQTYGNNEIEQHAKVFTGLAASIKPDGTAAGFGNGTAIVDLTQPMGVFDDFHDKSQKEIIGGNVFPHSQTGTDEVNQLIDVLFHNPNVGPFISKLLIQQFVKSNPTPQYVNRVATIFNNNGKGERGDMGAVAKAILMDPEARNCHSATLESSGKLLQPIERVVSLWKALNVSTPSGRMFINDKEEINLEQQFLNAPSVFNFFLPTYAENTFVAPLDLVSPEFEIFNSVTSIGYINTVEDKLKEGAFKNQTAVTVDSTTVGENIADQPVYDISYIENIYTNQGIAPMIDHLDILLCRGQLNAQARALVTDTITAYSTNVADYTATNAVKDAIYFIASTPNFAILK